MKKFRILTRHLNKPLQLYNDITFHSFVSEDALLPKVKVTAEQELFLPRSRQRCAWWIKWI
jgi:hypothetical protein